MQNLTWSMALMRLSLNLASHLSSCLMLNLLSSCSIEKYVHGGDPMTSMGLSSSICLIALSRSDFSSKFHPVSKSMLEPADNPIFMPCITTLGGENTSVISTMFKPVNIPIIVSSATPPAPDGLSSSNIMSTPTLSAIDATSSSVSMISFFCDASWLNSVLRLVGGFLSGVLHLLSDGADVLDASVISSSGSLAGDPDMSNCSASVSTFSSCMLVSSTSGIISPACSPSLPWSAMIASPDLAVQ